MVPCGLPIDDPPQLRATRSVLTDVRPLLLSLLLLVLPSTAHAGWSEPIGPGATPFSPTVIAPTQSGGAVAGWLERDTCADWCVARLRYPKATIERRKLDPAPSDFPMGRAPSVIDFDARGNALIASEVERPRRLCPRSGPTVGIKVQRWPRGRRLERPQWLESRCDAEQPSLDVNARGVAVLGWKQAGRVRAARGTTSRGFGASRAVSQRRASTRGPSVGVDDRGDAVIVVHQDYDIAAAKWPASRDVRPARAVGKGLGRAVLAVAGDGGAVLAWTMRPVGGEYGTSDPTTLRAARLTAGATRFERPQLIARGLLRGVAVDARAGAALLGWAAEDDPRGGEGGVAYAGPGNAFQAMSFPQPMQAHGVVVTPQGTAYARLYRSGAPATLALRDATGEWTEAEYPGGALGLTGSGDLIAVGPGGVSRYRP